MLNDAPSTDELDTQSWAAWVFGGKQAADKNGDGKMNYAEFVEMMTNNMVRDERREETAYCRCGYLVMSERAACELSLKRLRYLRVCVINCFFDGSYTFVLMKRVRKFGAYQSFPEEMILPLKVVFWSAGA